MMINRPRFFVAIRASVFGGRMSEGQVAGLTSLLDVWERSYAAPQWLAYALATVMHETAGTIQPISEYGLGRGRPYGVADPETHQTYYGRGYVQLTWRANYKKMGTMLGVDLVNHPELALVPANAAAILFAGMRDGDFTGVGFARYFGPGIEDPVNARRIINGLDCAERIAGYYAGFRDALGAVDPAPQAAAPPAPAELIAEVAS